ncbi:ribosomal protein L1, partial [Aureobasidium melanogenum]
MQCKQQPGYKEVPLSNHTDNFFLLEGHFSYAAIAVLDSSFCFLRAAFLAAFSALSLFDFLALVSSLAPSLLLFFADFESSVSAAFEHIGFVCPELVGEPDGQGGGVEALYVQGADVSPALGDVLLGQDVHDGVDVCGNLFSGHAALADSDADVCAGCEVDESGTDSALDLVGQSLGGDLDALVASLIASVLGLALHGDGDGALGSGAVEDLSEESGQTGDDAVIGEEDVVLGEELAARLVGLVLCLELLGAEDTVDAGGELGGEAFAGYDVLVLALGVGGDQADAQRGRGGGLQREGNDDLAGLHLALIGNVFLGGDVEPDGGRGLVAVLVLVGVLEQVGLAAIVLARNRVAGDLLKQSSSSTESLRRVQLVGRAGGDLCRQRFAVCCHVEYVLDESLENLEMISADALPPRRSERPGLYLAESSFLLQLLQIHA